MVLSLKIFNSLFNIKNMAKIFFAILLLIVSVCVIGQNFTTQAAAPSVITNSSTLITPSSATLNGSGNPNGEATTGWFRYSTVSPGTANNSFGIRVPVSGGTLLGSGSSQVSFSEAITGLAANTTYYYCAIVQNASGTSFGVLLSFTTPVVTPPSLITNAPTLITSNSSTLNGSGNPNGNTSTGWFRYSTVNPGTGNESFGTRVPASGGLVLGSGTVMMPYSQVITGLTPNTTYYYCAIVQNAGGISFGSLVNFTTPASIPSTMAILKNGNVGIGGNDSPVNRLHIIGGTDLNFNDSSGFITLGKVDGGNMVLDNNEIQVRNNGAASNLFIQSLGGDVRLANNTIGLVQVGTTPGTPIPGGVRFYVNGDAAKPGTNSWIVSSDMRLKQNIKPYSEGLATLLKINPVWFNYNQLSGFDVTKTYVGVLAQELQAVSSYMVTESAVKKAANGSGYLSVDNSAMTYMLINAIKEQQKQIEDLKAIVEKLQNK